MAKFYDRGEPEDDNLKAQIAEIRDLYSEDYNKIALDEEFPNHTLHDLVSGEVELAAEDGGLYRLYIVRSGPTDKHLVVDDYHPDADADRTVDAYGRIEGDEIPKET